MKKMEEFVMFDYHEYGSRIDPERYEETGIMPINNLLLERIYMNAISLDKFNYGYFEEEYHPSKHISEKYGSKIYEKLLDEVFFKTHNSGFNGYRDYHIGYWDSLWHSPEYELYGNDFVFQAFLTRLINHFSNYIFGGSATDFIKSIQEESKEDVDKKIDINGCAAILLDFMNFVAKSRDWHTVFTINDLYDEYSKQKHRVEMQELKYFIILANDYKKLLSKGVKLDNILLDFFEKKSIYVTKVFDRVSLNSVDEGHKEFVDKTLYALAYAYAKSSDRTKSKCSKSKNKNVSQEEFLAYAKTLQEENLENALNSILGENNVGINELMSKKISAIQYETINKELYNLLCAYYYNKMDFQTSSEIIDAKIKEMSKR